jgi:type II secretory pathway pseudopilin PulG
LKATGKWSFRLFFNFLNFIALGLLFFFDYYKIKFMRGLLIIVLIALAIVVLLFTTKDSGNKDTYAQRVIHALDQAEQLALNSRINAIKQALNAYLADNGRYPETLDLLVPDYLRIEDHIRDPWGKPFKIETDEEMKVTLTSSGKDGIWGNADDIKRSF